MRIIRHGLAALLAGLSLAGHAQQPVYPGGVYPMPWPGYGSYPAPILPVYPIYPYPGYAAPVQATPAPALQPAPQAPAPVTPPNAAQASTATSAPAQQDNPWLRNLPFNPFQAMLTPSPAKTKPYTMNRIISQEEKKQLMQVALPMVTGLMNMKMSDAMNYYALKYKAKPGLSFDDVRDSLFLRANQLNMKKVGENLMWKDFQAVLNDPEAPRIEVYSFCDIAIGRELLRISPEFIVFLPCRIAVMEDANKDIWVLMLDWNPEWAAGYKDRLGISDALWEGAVDIHKRMDEMMRAAANGDL